MNVLFVCTGNVCRSPMAEAFLAREAERHGLELRVRSTGTHAMGGRPATISGRKIMRELGVPMDQHRTLELTRELVEWADLIVALATEHVRAIAYHFPDAIERTFLLKELVTLVDDAEATVGAEGWMAELAAARDRASDLPDPDVADPYGAHDEAYRVVANEIQDLIDRFVGSISAHGAPER